MVVFSNDKGMFVWRDFWEDEKLRKEKWRDNYFKMDVWLGRGEDSRALIFVFHFFVLLLFFFLLLCFVFLFLCVLIFLWLVLFKKKNLKCPYAIFLNKKCVTFLFYLMGNIIVNLYQLHFPSSHFFS